MSPSMSSNVIKITGMRVKVAMNFTPSITLVLYVYLKYNYLYSTLTYRYFQSNLRHELIYVKKIHF